MANTLTAVIPQLLAQGLVTLRQNSIMPRLVARGLERQAGEKGSTIDVPIASAIAAQDVAPGAVPPATADITPTKIQVTLDKWKEAPFYLTDKEMLEVMDGTIPMQAAEAVKAIANVVDIDLLTLYKGVYGYAGTAGTTPFGTANDLSDILSARAVLERQLAAKTDRRVVLDTLAEAKALNQRAIQDASWRQSTQGIMEAQIGRTLGFDWFGSQNVLTHATTTFTAGAVTVNGAHAVNAGSTDNGRTGTVSIAKATNASPLVFGDILEFAGDTQTYTVLADVTLIVGNTSVSISPALRVSKAGGEAVTKKAAHTVNLAFQRDAFALASRPFAGADPMGLGKYLTAVDEVSGLVLRLEVSREHKRTRFAYDILYGVKLIRPEFAARLAG